MAGPYSEPGKRSSQSRNLFGDEFDPQSLEWRLFQNIAIGEAAFLAAGWATGHEADALRTAAAALHSAWWLWLEDTDDAMTCVRGVLEQTCRARAHRVKPARAARIEDMGAAASTARWLETAGRKRLAVLGRALGEFAHISFRARWSGARDALASLQADDTPRGTRPREGMPWKCRRTCWPMRWPPDSTRPAQRSAPRSAHGSLNSVRMSMNGELRNCSSEA